MSVSRILDFFQTKKQDAGDVNPEAPSWLSTLAASSWNITGVTQKTFRLAMLGTLTLIDAAAAICFKDQSGHTYDLRCVSVQESRIFNAISAACAGITVTSDCPTYLTEKNQYCRGLTDGIEVCDLYSHAVIIGHKDPCVFDTVSNKCWNFGTPLDMVATVVGGVAVLAITTQAAVCFFKCRAKKKDQVVAAAVPNEQQALLPAAPQIQ